MTSISTYPSIEELIPHRGRMLLIDEIITIDGESAASRATPTDQWPLSDGVAVNSLLLIELVAQTSGLSNGLECLNIEGRKARISGWLVGIKHAQLKLPAIALGSEIVTETRNSFKFEGFREIEGCCKLGQEVIGEVTLQVVRAQ
jgi:predicted hotdog family 3-hydroxylacyl-ACP dehydratase